MGRASKDPSFDKVLRARNWTDFNSRAEKLARNPGNFKNWTCGWKEGFTRCYANRETKIVRTEPFNSQAGRDVLASRQDFEHYST